MPTVMHRPYTAQINAAITKQDVTYIGHSSNYMELKIERVDKHCYIMKKKSYKR